MAPVWNVFSKTCPSRTSLARIANKWTAMIVISLSERPHRFGELQTRLEGISKKVLSDTLQALERDGMVERALVGEAPGYGLTPLGRTLEEPLLALQRWSESHIEDVLESRDRWDAAADDAVLGIQQRP
ncbi:winged helix-turn-helix transcriptional regulator [Plantibacter sp. Mn2098]|uniref:winged helix-turn-helix transcriptional regulator n=1 Tax=Plantibacter sp. Mn2098 TaxID=3395266 RepID=UPI003BD35D09